MKVALIVHGAKRKAKQSARRIVDCAPSNWAPKILLTQQSGDARYLASHAADERFDLIVAVGGDGTLNGCVNALMDAPPGQDLPPLALYPAGSGNDFARSIGMKDQPARWVRRITRARPTYVDVVELSSGDRKQFFINSAEVGLSSQVIRRAESWQRWIGNRAAYLLSIASVVMRRPTTRLDCRGNAFKFAGEMTSIVVANGKYFAGGLNIAPQAEWDDGQLIVVILRELKLLDVVRNLPNLWSGRIITSPKVEYREATQLSIEGDGQIEFDGELGPPLPVHIRVLPRAIALLF